MSQNDVVLCRSFGNEPLVRVVWSVTDEGILIYGQDNKDWLKPADPDDSVPVLAPFDAVYEYDELLFPQLEKTFRSYGGLSPRLERLWEQARPYKVTVANTNKVDK
jgi:hypothetical protein